MRSAPPDRVVKVAWCLNCFSSFPPLQTQCCDGCSKTGDSRMNENRLQNATLLTWTLQVYKDFNRGIAQTPHEAVIARAMQNHREWWPDWEAFDRGTGVEDTTSTSRLMHIHHDAR